MSVRDQQIDDELKNISVTKDAFELWLQNDVTRMFMLNMEKDYISNATLKTFGQTIEQIAMGEILRSANLSCLESVMEWSPNFGDEE